MEPPAPGAVDVKFAWTPQMIGPRAGYHPREEGNRAQAYSDRCWSPVETLPRDRIREIQLARLKTLLTHVQANSPFYAERWKAAGVVAEDVRSLEDLAAFPIITKEDIEKDQLESPPYGSAFTVPPHRQMKLWLTSGTTGVPRLWAETKEDWENGMYLYARALYAHGVRPGWRGFFSFGYPPFIAFWLCHYAAEMMGCQAVPKGPLPTQAWLGLLKRLAGTAPSFVCATPTYAQRLLDVATDAGIDPKGLGIRLLTLAGEPGACVPATKAGLEAAWGAKTHDIFGSTEVSGPVGFTCDAQADLAEPSDHVNVDYFILELLDPETRRPVPEGEAGALCVTALGRTGIPAVRFLLNDYLRLAWEPCVCGRTLPLVKGGLRARADDMIIVKGVNVYPSLIENLVRSVPGLSTEYALVRREGTVVIRVEALPGTGVPEYDALARRVQADIRTGTSLTLPVEVLPPGSLPRSETKTKRVSSG